MTTRAALAAALTAVAALLFAALSLNTAAGGGPGGKYPVDVNLQEDVCNHDPHIGMPDNLTLDVLIDGQEIFIQSQPTTDPDDVWVDVQGTVKGNEFFAFGTGEVASSDNVTVVFQGTIDDAVIAGKYEMGAKGELPPCDHDDDPATPLEPRPAIYEIKPKDVTPTPSATATPEEKLFSIMVLKLDADSDLPLEDWEFNIYRTTDCTGTPFDSGVTDEDGLLDFTGLESGVYSVEEKPQDGWNAVSDECQAVALGGSAAGLPPCPTQPDQPFPQPGCDSFDSGARVKFQLNGSDEVHIVTLNGPTQIERKNKPAKEGGLDRIDTEIVHMELLGQSALGPIAVTESSDRESTGQIVEQTNTGAGKMNFPANSFFDVFFEVSTVVGTLHNQEPLRMECKIEEVPPILCFYLPPITEPLVLYNDSKEKVATIRHALHLPLPPNEHLVIFENEQKVDETPTPTPPTSATATPTPSATPPTGATATPTRTPTATPVPPTPTPTPREKPCGDVNDDGVVNALDSLLILQFVAGLIDRLPNPESADGNADGAINAIDSALLLQFGARLLLVLNCP